LKVVFHNPQLELLYATGKSRKYRLAGSVVQRFVKVVGLLQEAHVITDLWATPSLKFEKLMGNNQRYSVRVTQQYRLEMEIDWENTEKTIGVLGLEELSNHYGG